MMPVFLLSEKIIKYKGLDWVPVTSIGHLSGWDVNECEYIL